jgi:hypothetical protein
MASANHFIAALFFFAAGELHVGNESQHIRRSIDERNWVSKSSSNEGYL